MTKKQRNNQQNIQAISVNSFIQNMALTTINAERINLKKSKVILLDYDFYCGEGDMKISNIKKDLTMLLKDINSPNSFGILQSFSRQHDSCMKHAEQYVEKLKVMFPVENNLFKNTEVVIKDVMTFFKTDVDKISSEIDDARAEFDQFFNNSGSDQKGYSMGDYYISATLISNQYQLKNALNRLSTLSTKDRHTEILSSGKN